MGIHRSELTEAEQYLYDIVYKQIEKELKKHQDIDRECVIYTGDGKGNLVPIEQTERFSKLLKEYIKNEWDENSREIL